MRANHTPHLRAVRMRRIRRRSYLADGVISIYVVKIIPPPYDGPPIGALPEPDPRPWHPCSKCGRYIPPTQTECAQCWQASISPPSPPWPTPGGAA